MWLSSWSWSSSSWSWSWSWCWSAASWSSCLSCSSSLSSSSSLSLAPRPERLSRGIPAGGPPRGWPESRWPMLACEQDEAFSAYFCVVLFDSIGYELHPQDLQESAGPVGTGIYCTLDLNRALATQKEVLVAEFRPTPSESLRSGSTELLIAAAAEDGSAGSGSRWRQRGYSGVLYGATELCIRAECIRALYRRDWQRPGAAWADLDRLLVRMRDPPFLVDPEVSQPELAWAKALERLRLYGDQRVKDTRERLENLWLDTAQQAESQHFCVAQ
ncbi:unnamed protein product [Prorocentrum cordatum]|uniref:RING-type E3 ubiquitin transferase n=1 Tax=Prorocentrum cordatum TaxID=2364126 RepID=A0ABN9RES4_9DINO|nr:unnamed protein product [Polarella glacialis]